MKLKPNTRLSLHHHPLSHGINPPPTFPQGSCLIMSKFAAERKKTDVFKTMAHISPSQGRRLPYKTLHFWFVFRVFQWLKNRIGDGLRFGPV